MVQRDIHVWYGCRQAFGVLGRPQRAVNVLGDVAAPAELLELTWRIGDGPVQRVSVGPDDEPSQALCDLSAPARDGEARKGSVLLIALFADVTIHSLRVDPT